MRITVVVPALDEALILPETLRRLRIAERAAAIEVDLIVVDNGSSDDTASIARAHGAQVISEPERRGVGRVRNVGAAAATGDVLVFVDADVAVPETTLIQIANEMADAKCIGGAFDTDYRPQRHTVRLYLRLWRLVSLVTRMAQGACQFCTR